MRRDGIPWDDMPKSFQDAITSSSSLPCLSLSKISFEKDRLLAILAMATQILDRSEDRCLAGIWEVDILPGLLWRYFGRGGIDSTGNETIFFPMSKIGTELQAPSWSLASAEGPITYSPVRGSSRRTVDAEILAVNYPKVYNDSRYIISSSCSLPLRGRLMNVMLDLPDRLLLREIRRQPSHIAHCSSAFLDTQLKLNRILQFRCTTIPIGVIMQFNLVATAA
ncbi:heterokaryon incompatibility protein [Colletotrichum chrysophilum]|uniref:Heterokaryon incompatibility protein n=1 Tax=Colletotrichum chrysophilum TaxID=1836956 RepID=A0AAD9A3L6_9PEZI|nr:heterokaryon incompatibility protein [Colletotrichum chrysophilum]